jgi:hypothetical protein
MGREGRSQAWVGDEASVRVCEVGGEGGCLRENEKTNDIYLEIMS